MKFQTSNEWTQIDWTLNRLLFFFNLFAGDHLDCSADVLSLIIFKQQYPDRSMFNNRFLAEVNKKQCKIFTILSAYHQCGWKSFTTIMSSLLFLRPSLGCVWVSDVKGIFFPNSKITLLGVIWIIIIQAWTVQHRIYSR